jgi:hypothetical protein
MSGTPATHIAGTIVDADAVCEVCGNVNVEATLICRICGNNLRDQKARRLAAEALLLDSDRPSSRQFVRGGLVVLALLVLAWTAINANRIADAVINANAPEDPLSALFASPQDAVFSEMLAEAQALAPTLEQVQSYAASGVVGDGIAGRYALVMNSTYGGPVVVGTAVVRSDAAGTLFVASLGEIHLRGTAQAQGVSAYRSAWNDAAGRDAQGQIFAVSGVAVTQPDGSVECFGQSTLDESNYEVVAYRLP